MNRRKFIAWLAAIPAAGLCLGAAKKAVARLQYGGGVRGGSSTIMTPDQIAKEALYQLERNLIASELGIDRRDYKPRHTVKILGTGKSGAVQFTVTENKGAEA